MLTQVFILIKKTKNTIRVLGGQRGMRVEAKKRVIKTVVAGLMGLAIAVTSVIGAGADTVVKASTTNAAASTTMSVYKPKNGELYTEVGGKATLKKCKIDKAEYKDGTVLKLKEQLDVLDSKGNAVSYFYGTVGNSTKLVKVPAEKVKKINLSKRSAKYQKFVPAKTMTATVTKDTYMLDIVDYDPVIDLTDYIDDDKKISASELKELLDDQTFENTRFHGFGDKSAEKFRVIKVAKGTKYMVKSIEYKGEFDTSTNGYTKVFVNTKYSNGDIQYTNMFLNPKQVKLSFSK